MSVLETVDRYRVQSLQYLDNAARTLRAGEIAKAGEFLWGSLAEALKGVAAAKGIVLRTHWDLGSYARSLAKELGDESVYKVYVEASHLHSNFYEAELRAEDVTPLVDGVRALVRRLLDLLPESDGS